MTEPTEFPLPNARGPAKKMGRKTLMSKEKSELIVDLLRRGNYLTQAAAYAGVSAHTITQWRNKGRELVESGRDLDETEQLFATFYLEVEKAKAEAEIRAVEVIRSAMGNQWQAAAWYLERTNNRDWGRTVKTEVTGAEGGAVQVDADVVMRKLEALTSRTVIDVQASEPVERKVASDVTLEAVRGAIEAAVTNALDEDEEHDPASEI